MFFTSKKRTGKQRGPESGMSYFPLFINVGKEKENKEKQDAKFFWSVTSVRSSNQCWFAWFPAHNTYAICGGNIR
jgi:hypothetical protein